MVRKTASTPSDVLADVSEWADELVADSDVAVLAVDADDPSAPLVGLSTSEFVLEELEATASVARLGAFAVVYTRAPLPELSLPPKYSAMTVGDAVLTVFLAIMVMFTVSLGLFYATQKDPTISVAGCLFAPRRGGVLEAPYESVDDL